VNCKKKAKADAMSVRRRGYGEAIAEQEQRIEYIPVQFYAAKR